MPARILGDGLPSKLQYQTTKLPALFYCSKSRMVRVRSHSLLFWLLFLLCGKTISTQGNYAVSAQFDG